ncbi:MAG: FtsX-like permease family protein [Acidobacteriota bacterium]
MSDGVGDLFHRWVAALEEALFALGRRLPTTLLAVFAIAWTLLLPSLLVTRLLATSERLEAVADDASWRVFLDARLSVEEAESVRTRLLGLGAVEAARLVSPDEAALVFAERFPELADLVVAVAPEPTEATEAPPEPEDVVFTWSVDCALSASVADPTALRARVETWAEVDEVRDDLAEGRERRRRARDARWAAGLVTISSILVTAFGVGHVIALSALSRREELTTLRLVGAPRFHLRVPFWLEGVMQGLGGGLATVALLLLLRRLAGLAPWALGASLSETTLAPAQVVVLVLVPTLAAGLGAAVAVELVLRRHARLER